MQSSMQISKMIGEPERHLSTGNNLAECHVIPGKHMKLNVSLSHLRWKLALNNQNEQVYN